MDHGHPSPGARPAPDTVRCRECPGHPVVPLPRGALLGAREPVAGGCLLCRRPLPTPHPADHLCRSCRGECLQCRAPVPEADRAREELCRSCRGECADCSAALPPMPWREPGRPDAGRLPRGEADRRCRPCRSAYLGAHPVARVLAALPPVLLRACGGTTSPLVGETVRDELQRLPPDVLIARIERRWWTFWSHRSLHVPRSEHDQGYGPDDVAYWLVLPHPCRVAQCEDGWLLDDSGVCPACRPAGRMAPETVDWQPEQRADPVRAAAIAADIRRELRWRHGAPRSGRRRAGVPRRGGEPEP